MTSTLPIKRPEAQRLNHGPQSKSLFRYPCGADAIQMLAYNTGCRPEYIPDGLAFEHLAVHKDSQCSPPQIALMCRIL